MPIWLIHIEKQVRHVILFWEKSKNVIVFWKKICFFNLLWLNLRINLKIIKSNHIKSKKL